MEDHWDALSAAERSIERMGIDTSLVSDVMLETFEACKLSWDAERGTFKGYYLHCVRRAVVRRLKEVRAKRDLPQAFGHSPLEELINAEARAVDPHEFMRSRLTDDEYDLVCDKYVRGMSLWQIGAKHGILKQSAWARLQKALSKLR